MNLENSQKRERCGTDKRGFPCLLAVALALAGVVVVFATGTAAGQMTSAPDCSTVGYNGVGMVSNPFEVTNASQLQCMGNASTSTSLSDNFTQVSDIDATGTDQWNGGAGFKPVGNSATAFTGTFDGSNHRITGLFINRSRSGINGTGLFGVAGSGAVVENVGLESISVTNPSNSNVGGLVGESEGAVNSSYATGNVTGSSDVGGLVGFNEGGKVNESYATGNVTGSGDVGGLVGTNLGKVNESYATGNVTGSDDVGGLVGRNDRTIYSSYATGNVTGSNNDVGGLVGSNRDTVTESYATGNVSGSDRVGGLVGTNRGRTVATVESSHATGKVTGSDSVGGLVGFNRGNVTESYATGNVSSTGNIVGGLVGENSLGTVNTSHATGNVTGSFGVGGLVGFNEGGKVNTSYATGDVNGSGNLGGLVGDNEGTLNESYATGNVTGTGNKVGGLVGGNLGAVNESYATGNVSGDKGVGGLVGANGGTVNDSYWDVNTTNQTSSDGGTGLTTEQMTGDAAETNMTGFGFGTTWVTTDTYPQLRWSVEQLALNAPGALTLGETASAPSAFEIVDGRTPSVTAVANYLSSDTSVITVSSPLDAVGVGTATVTAENFGFTDSQEVTVEPIDCVNRRSVSRDQEDEECPSDRAIERGESRDELDRNTGRNSDTRRRDRSRGQERSRGR